jgi:hypothetical protein
VREPFCTVSPGPWIKGQPGASRTTNSSSHSNTHKHPLYYCAQFSNNPRHYFYPDFAEEKPTAERLNNLPGVTRPAKQPKQNSNPGAELHSESGMLQPSHNTCLPSSDCSVPLLTNTEKKKKKTTKKGHPGSPQRYSEMPPSTCLALRRPLIKAAAGTLSWFKKSKVKATITHLSVPRTPPPLQPAGILLPPASLPPSLSHILPPNLQRGKK